jgi:general secretion pathway protein G
MTKNIDSQHSKRHNYFAAASICLIIVGFVIAGGAHNSGEFSLIISSFSIVSVIFAILGLKQAIQLADGRYLSIISLVIAGLLLVTTVFGIIAGRKLASSKREIAVEMIERIGTALKSYKQDVGSFPTTDQGLAALVAKPDNVTKWNGPYVGRYTNAGEMPRDPWGRSFTYHNPSSRPGHDYDLCSDGPSYETGSQEQGAICNP